MNFPTILVADGTQLSLPGGKGTAALSVADDEDWLEVLNMARKNISNGGAWVGPGETWEQALANNAARLLHAGVFGTTFPAMGRTPDEGEWALQKERWIELIYGVAELGSAHTKWVPGTNPPQFVFTGTVFTANGRVDLVDVAHEAR